MPIPETRLPSTARLVASGAGLSHRGRVRSVNEDEILTDPTGALWVVADGLGGLGHGDVASDIVIDAFARLPHGAAGRSALQDAIAAANAEIRRQSRAGHFGTMASTVVAASVSGGRAVIAWAGDSRAYLWRAPDLTRLTHDHSLVQEMVDSGALDPEMAEHHPEAHIVTRAVGADERIEPAFREVTLRDGDRLLLCSDGLTRCVPEAGIGALISAAPTPDAACRDLVDAALDEGAPDNVSVIVVSIGRSAPP